jgi:FkbM family methyltransferase
VRRLYSALSTSTSAVSDRQTVELMRRRLAPNSTCIDIGAYRGDLLGEMLRLAPSGRVLAFEPVPENARHLRRAFPDALIFERALSDEAAVVQLHHARGRPARSSLRRQSYPDPREAVAVLEVQTDTLDRVLARELGPDAAVDLVKIDVEGAELQVLRGGRESLIRHRPVVVFEHDPHTAARFGTASGDVFDLLSECCLPVRSLPGWLADSPELERNGFLHACQQGELYFVAG